jgi:hypothetical protein
MHGAVAGWMFLVGCFCGASVRFQLVGFNSSVVCVFAHVARLSLDCYNPICCLYLLREQGVVVDVAEIAIARAPFAGMLKTLDVALCGLDDAQLRHICEACPSLVRLVLAGNPGLTDPAPLARCTMVRWESVIFFI